MNCDTIDTELARNNGLGVLELSRLDRLTSQFSAFDASDFVDY